MEEILKRLEKNLGTARSDDDQSFKDMYKNWGKFGNQEERRTEILKQQKSNRENKLDSCRGLLALMENTMDTSDIEDSNRAKYTPSTYVPGFTKKSNHYDNILMFSEWLVAKPEDFNTNWYVTHCPKGIRSLVIASNGATRFYTKYGQLHYTTSSWLPGGNRIERRGSCSVLDCFFSRETETIYVLDVLTWNNHVMADGEMEFRHFWLQSKFNEKPELGSLCQRNKMIFKLLPMTPCDPNSFKKFMMMRPPFFKLDGLLFYHKYGRYVAGETPLVGWLYPFMVPEVISPDIAIHKLYAAEKPSDYVDQNTFIQQFQEKLSKKKVPYSKANRKPNSSSPSSMEAEDNPVNDDNTTAVVTMESDAPIDFQSLFQSQSDSQQPVVITK